MLAAQADARWAAKPRVLDMPRTDRSALAVPAGEYLRRGPGAHVREERPAGGHVGGPGHAGEGSGVEASGNGRPEIEMQVPDGKRHPFTRGERAPRTLKEVREDPWKKARRGPSEDWQPQAWDPNALAVKR